MSSDPSTHQPTSASAPADVLVRQLQDQDLAEADRIFRLAFGTFLGLPDPSAFGGDADLLRTRWLADPSAALVAERDGQVVGSNFLTAWGSFGFFGPLSVRPDLWDRGIARRLLEATLERFAAWQCRDLGLFTFPHSPKHLGLYQSFGFWPRFLTAIMLKSVASQPTTSGGAVLADIPAGERAATVQLCAALTNAIAPGLDPRREILAVDAQALGHTLLVREAEQLVGFAVCHVGANTEAGSERCYVKFAAARPGPMAQQHFEKVLGACEAFAAQRGATSLTAGVNTARHAAYQTMLRCGFHTLTSGVAMQRPNQAGFNREDAYVIDDWR